MQFADIVQRVFHYQNDDRYRENRGVYIASADTKDDTNLASNIIELEKCLMDLKMNFIVRIHPREKNDSDKYKGFMIDKGDLMWELICRDYITDDHILIGEYSTAQFSPKIMYDKEPWLILLYKILNRRRGSDTINTMETVIDTIKSSYSNPEKVIVINDFEEIRYTLNKLMDKR